jgi:anti-anti-sigma regulatory factor
MLSKLILLERRLKRRGIRLVLSDLRDEVRRVLRWTKLDRLFEINGDEE